MKFEFTAIDIADSTLKLCPECNKVRTAWVLCNQCLRAHKKAAENYLGEELIAEYKIRRLLMRAGLTPAMMSRRLIDGTIAVYMTFGKAPVDEGMWRIIVKTCEQEKLTFSHVEEGSGPVIVLTRPSKIKWGL